MAGGNQTKGQKQPSSNKPPNPPSHSSSSERNKSRLESSSSATAAAAATPPSNRKPSNSVHNKSTSTPNNSKPQTPKPKPNNFSGNKPSPRPPINPSLRGPRPVDPNPNHSKLPPFPFPDPPPPPTYGFHSLDRRTIVLADGSVRSYFALPPDYEDFIPFPPRTEFRGPAFGFDRKFPISPDFRGPELRHELGERVDGLTRFRNQDFRNAGNSLKRKFGDEEREGRDGFERQRLQLLQYGSDNSNAMAGTSGIHGEGRRGEVRAAKSMRIGEGSVGKTKHHEVDQDALRKAFLHFVKLIFENATQKKKYLANGKQGSLQCVACGRSSKDFTDMHGLIMHVYSSDAPNLAVEHLGLHKALCILMGWNYRIPPDNSKAYQFLSAEEAVGNLDDLIMWPPLVIIHNTITGKGREGRMEGLGNRAMDNFLRDLGFHGGKSKSMYSKDGHLGITLIKFGSNQSGLMEALQLAEYFERENHGRNGWARVESLNLSKEDDNNPNLVKVDEKTKEKKRIFYGYMATVSDLDRVDFETRKKVVIHSRKESELPK
ncbi:OLC1v1020043C1 [Oldenlandia corymbosa var. corymbosa]|uniref:OLC1v1020043C1 n=1 Tax=Oldenlandia corymbosa var. corymbosa TaxID=529605 RepID=A0AAV1EFF3_OLDCO|nr:OLC1v1020043C1 [Oldenlandia corymbosa var. corymbosa]